MRKINYIAILERYFSGIKHFLEEKYYFASLIASAILSFLILCIFEQRNLLNVTNANTAISILAAIASILASIIGIIVAISLVSFELQLKKYGYSVFKKFFIYYPFRFFLWTFIGTIIYIIISAVSIRAELSSIDLRIFRSLYLFIFCLLILPFSIQEILLLSEPKKKVKEIISELIKKLKNFKTTDFTDSSQGLEDQISQLQEVFSNTLKDNDKETLKFILSELDNKTTEYLVDKQSGIIPNSIDKISSILNSFIEEAFIEKNLFTAKAILNNLEDLRVCVEKYETKTSKLLNLDLSIRHILWQATTANLTSVVEKGFEIMEANLEEDFKNHPLFIKKENDENESETLKYHQENYIEANYLSTINNIIERAIELERIDIIRRGFLSINEISLSVAQNKNLDNYVRQKIVEKSYLTTRFLTLKCVDRGIYKMVSEDIFYSFAVIYHAFAKEPALYDRPIQYFLATMIEITKKDSVDINYLYSGLNIMWGIADKCLLDLNDQLFLNTLSLIIVAFNDIKNIIEKKEDNLDNENAYVFLHLHLESILKEMKDKNLHNKEIEEKISSILKKFKETEK